MLIKEYRIPLPLTVEEYRIAQLYMIAKKSREESKGTGSGVEILVNEPYDGGPGGNGGQYTRKLYHIGSHLPSWFKSLIPKAALITEEEAWNAYPYTKTRYTSPFVEKFLIEIETYYFNDNGYQENVFNLTGSDLRNRVVDLIDIVKEQQFGADYVKEEDPKIYVSEKNNQGPLTDNWLEEYWNECKGKQTPLPNGKRLMCAYKLCRVEFRVWGMQTKTEKFLHDIALRKTMARAHKQAWAWQDEWADLTMDDIRQIERETQEALKKKMGMEESELDESGNELDNGRPGSRNTSSSHTLQATFGSIENTEDMQTPPVTKKLDKIPTIKTEGFDKDGSPPEILPTELNTRHVKDSTQELEGRKRLWYRSNSKTALHSPSSGSNKSFDLQLANWRMDTIARYSDSSSDDEEFFDCQADTSEAASLAKWSSLDLLTEEDLDVSPTSVMEKQDSIFSPSFLQRVTSDRRRPLALGGSMDTSCPGSPVASSHHATCSTTVLILVMHAGSVLDANVDLTSKKSDITTFRGAFESVMRQHYPTMVGHIAIKLVSCPSVCTEGLGILSSLSPYSFDVSPSCTDAPHVTHDSIPIGAIPLFASSTPEYKDSVSRVINGANTVYQEFIKSEEGQGFCGQICVVGDGVGSIMAYDALCRSSQYQSRHDSENSILDTDAAHDEKHDACYLDTGLGDQSHKHLAAPVPRRRSSSTSDQAHHCKLDFEVSDFFMFGSPLALVLAYRKVSSTEDKNAPIPKPMVQQVYNLFHPTDPVAARLEPLLSARFSMLPPVNIARYQKYPLGNGQPYHLLEIIQTNPQMFAESLTAPPTPGSHLRRLSEISMQSTISGHNESLPMQTINALTQKWWGTKRLDYALYCPDGLANFPTNALPHLFHASYWESSDVIAFIIRQMGRIELNLSMGGDDRDMTSFSPSQPREKWTRKRTSVKVKNVAANHRANDVIVREGASQTVVARFMYGLLGLIALTGEKVDIHVMKDPPAGEWIFQATEVTDKAGRITYTFPTDQALGYGLYPLKMVVRGDHTSVDFYMAVVPPKTECVVFSIDGSFTASMSVTGRDPKVRAGAVDIVRHWQELGYLIIYVTMRPDIQQHQVVSWLSQHNFPHGLVSFADGLSTSPLGHKAAYLKTLVESHGLVIHAAYGSSKDISVYQSIGLKTSEIIIVGKVSRKHHALATVLMEGYAAHLSTLISHGGSRPAQGNARMVIPRGYFGLPGQNASLRRRRSAKRAASIPLVAGVTSASVRRPRKVTSRPREETSDSDQLC